MNHLRELLETRAERWLVPGEVDDRDAFSIEGDLKKFGPQAQCFWLGEVDDTEGLQVIPDLCRLPFAVCWFEIACSEDSRSWIYGLLAVAHPNGIRLTGFRRIERVWELRFVTDLERFDSSLAWTLPPNEQAANETRAVRQKVGAFLSALHCSNVRRAKHDADVKLQRARAKRGKAPLFSYWTLELDGKAERGPEQGGTHATPRVHLRRGHPRQYAPGKWTWVQAHAVGNRSAGMVHKQYSAAALMKRPRRDPH